MRCASRTSEVPPVLSTSGCPNEAALLPSRQTRKTSRNHTPVPAACRARSVVTVRARRRGVPTAETARRPGHAAMPAKHRSRANWPDPSRNKRTVGRAGGADLGPAVHRGVQEDGLIGHELCKRTRLEEPADVRHLRRTGMVERFVPRVGRPDHRLASRLPHLPDVVVAT